MMIKKDMELLILREGQVLIKEGGQVKIKKKMSEGTCGKCYKDECVAP